VSDYVSFDEQRFIASLRAEIEKEIINHAAEIRRQRNIEGDFNSSEFYIEYTQEGIKGRIVISGKMIEGGYYLTAEIEEISEAAEFPFAVEEVRDSGGSVICAATAVGGFPFAADDLRKVRPEGDFYVAPFRQDDPLARNDKFQRIGAELIMASRVRIPPGITKEGAGAFQYAEVWSLVNIPRQLKRYLGEKGVDRNVDMPGECDVPEEYKEYERVYFLNEVALRMYREGGIALDALKKVSGAEMPERCNRILRGPYIPQ